MSTQKTEALEGVRELPELPRPAVHAFGDIGEGFLRHDHYTADQMRAYALAALAATPAAPRSAAPGWIMLGDRLPEWAVRDDTPCFINGKEVPPTLTSAIVLVALKDGGVRTDKLITIEGKSDGWWNTFGERVVAWQPTPSPPVTPSEGGKQ